MIPLIALIGRPNVGKSTIFNLLTKTRKALVSDTLEVTRDRHYGRGSLCNYEFICIDTGGINYEKKDIAKKVLVQSFLAIDEADIIWFIVNAREGIMPTDIVIADHLRSIKKITALVINKIDGINIEQEVSDFWSLGFKKIYPISASQGYGINHLSETLLLRSINSIDSIVVAENKNFSSCLNNKINSEFNTSLPIKVAIFGRPNVGKSTLINRLLGEDRMIVHHTPGTTRDCIYLPMKHNQYEYVLIDTAGIRRHKKIFDKTEKYAVLKSKKATKTSDVVLLVIDANEGISDQDLVLLNFIIKSGRSLVIVINKWDILSQINKKKMKEQLEYRLGFVDFLRLHFISALHGKGIIELLYSIKEAYNNSTCYIKTKKLTQFVHLAVKNHMPPLVNNRCVKLKYAHIGGYNPLIVVIHGSKVKNIPNPYKRYLAKYIQKSLGIKGAPIQIQFKEKN